MPKVTQQDISTSFGRNIIDRGTVYFKESRVLACDYDEESKMLVGLVKGSDDVPYNTKASIKTSNKGGYIIQSTCSCPVGWNCKHAVALLLAYQADTPNYNIENSYQTWFEMLNGKVGQVDKVRASAYQGFFRFSFDRKVLNHEHRYIKVEYGSVRFLKSENAYVFSEKDLVSVADNESWMESFKWVEDVDVEILRLLLTKEGRTPKLGKTYIKSELDLLALQKILHTGRCFWEQLDQKITLSEPRSISLDWDSTEDNLKQLTVNLNECENWLLIPTPKPYFYDLERHQFGEIDTPFNRDWLLSLLQTPPLGDEQCAHFTQEVSLGFSQDVLPNPEHYDIQHIDEKLQVIFKLDVQKIKSQDLFLGRLYFKYGDLLLTPSILEDEKRNQYMHKGQIVSLSREIEAELEAVKEFNELCLLDVYMYDPKYKLNKELQGILPPELGGTQEFQWLSLLTAHKARLEVLGWKFDIAKDLALQSQHVDSIDIDVDEKGNWFDLGVSIEIEGSRIELLPLLLEWLRSNEDWQQNNYDILLAQGNGRPLRVKRESIQPVLSVLQELGEVNENKINLPQNQAALLAQLPDINRWVGGEHVQALAKKLVNFSGIQEVPAPEKLSADLRDYQKDGLNWLMFLNEYGFSGVLADDMGLGKTVQTLAYLAYKKELGLLPLPSMVICPTSLVSNWLNEAVKFTPDLKVLVLHGVNRHQHFKDINNYDLVITTYPLIARDAKEFTELSFSDLILDEAQTIKNPLAKMTKSIKLMDAKQRLCLTGTPMENHLGELWSLFDFLMPGFLGSYSTFNRVYRKGIEGEGNQQIQQWLIQKTKPFLLRRTKDDVAKELPAKTEIIHKIELQNDQRTLYESIRITMEAKVRDLLREKGMAPEAALSF